MRQRFRIPIVVFALMGLLVAGGWHRSVGNDDRTIPPEYMLTPHQGPWMIYVTTFAGDPPAPGQDGPREMAWRLVHELRTDYRLPAYVYSRSEEQRRKRDQILADAKRRFNGAPLKKVRIIDEYAVLVGNYPDLQSASKDLKRIKKLRPPRSAPVPFFLMGKPKPSKKSGLTEFKKIQAAKVNPFRNAFVVRNPLSPKTATGPSLEAKLQHELGKAPWMRLNSQERYCLLNCRDPWTLIVKVYDVDYGDGERPNFFGRLKKIGKGMFTKEVQPVGGDPEAVAAEARQLVELLRQSPYRLNAYVLHTPYTSFVTVGGFARKDDPRLLQLQQQLAGRQIGPHQLEKRPVPFPTPGVSPNLPNLSRRQ